MSGVVNRQQRRHEATVEEIKSAARELMTREGSSSLNLRAIARELGMAPSALYRYFPSRDAILTALITEAYDAVGEAVEAAVAQAPPDRTATAVLAGVHAFRRWAREHPHEYGLIYGSPVPGYEAPVEATKPAELRTSDALLGLLSRCAEQGLLTLPGDASLPADVLPALCWPGDDPGRPPLPLAMRAVAMQFWIVLLGAIDAEVFRHLPAPLLEHGGAFFDHTMRRALAVMGVDQRAIDAGVSPAW
jgi:AcrR family transcriptional regulator